MTVDAWERGLAGQAALLTQPPYVRQGWTELVRPANPAAGAGFARKVPNDTWDRLLAATFTLTNSAVNTLRQITLNYQDGDGITFAQVPVALTSAGLSVVTAFTSFTSPGLASQSIARTASGSVTSAAAGGTIASIPLSGGEWVVQWQVQVSGTLAAADQNNMQLSGPGFASVTSENGITAGQPYPQPSVTCAVPAAGSTVAVKAIAAATVGAVYVAQITCNQVAPINNYAEMPDITMKSGWQHSIVIANEDAGDQMSGIALLLERYPSSVAAGITP